MAVVILLVVVGLLCLAIASKIASSRRPAPPHGAPAVEELSAPVDAPTFRIVALGVAGSGKTVFLASMFHRLHVQGHRLSFFLETDTEQRIALSSIFRQVTSSDQPWPKGTSLGETREFVFDCSSFRDNVKHRIMRINYLDYAGEMLEAPGEKGTSALSDLVKRIEAAHVLLGILDGHRVLQYLRGEPQGRAYIHGAIQPMIGVMAAATCPIHIVVTKWDLVRGFGEPEDSDQDVRLAMVRAMLMNRTDIGAVAARHSQGRRIVRLIPVSAVGPGFASIDPGGEVVKRPEGEYRPANVEIPICAVLPDLFRQVESRLDEATRAALDGQVRRLMRLSPSELLGAAAKFLSLPAGVMVRTTMQATLGGSYGNEAAGMFLAWMGRSFDQKAEVVERAREGAEARAALSRQVRSDVLKDFDEAVLRFEGRFPSSVLTEGL